MNKDDQALILKLVEEMLKIRALPSNKDTEFEDNLVAETASLKVLKEIEKDLIEAHAVGKAKALTEQGLPTIEECLTVIRAPFSKYGFDPSEQYTALSELHRATQMVLLETDRGYWIAFIQLRILMRMLQRDGVTLPAAIEATRCRIGMFLTRHRVNQEVKQLREMLLNNPAQFAQFVVDNPPSPATLAMLSIPAQDTLAKVHREKVSVENTVRASGRNATTWAFLRQKFDALPLEEKLKGKAKGNLIAKQYAEDLKVENARRRGLEQGNGEAQPYLAELDEGTIQNKIVKWRKKLDT